MAGFYLFIIFLFLEVGWARASYRAHHNRVPPFDNVDYNNSIDIVECLNLAGMLCSSTKWSCTMWFEVGGPQEIERSL